MNGAPPTSVQTTSPSQVCYCQNLNDKINKQELRRSLYMLFSPHGAVLDVVALKTPKMRGQAHIVFKDVHTCTQAIRDLQDFELFGKSMKLSYGKGKSHIISRLDGSATSSFEANKFANATTSTSTSIFAAPPPAASSSLPPKPTLNVPNGAPVNAPSPQGTKRPRDEEDEDEEAMDESDGGSAMEESDDD